MQITGQDYCIFIISFLRLGSQELLLLSQCCSQLQVLVLELGLFNGDLIDCSEEDIVFTNIAQIQEPLFRTVETLQVIENVPASLFEMFSIWKI